MVMICKLRLFAFIYRLPLNPYHAALPFVDREAVLVWTQEHVSPKLRRIADIDGLPCKTGRRTRRR